MPEPGDDPLAAFGEATARPATDTTTRMKERLDVYVAQERSRSQRQRRRLMLVVSGVLLALAGVAAFVMFGG